MHYTDMLSCINGHRRFKTSTPAILETPENQNPIPEIQNPTPEIPNSVLWPSNMVSLDSTVCDSFDDNQSMEESCDASQEQTFVQQKTVKNSRLNLGKMRGMKVVWNHFFAKTPGKRMSVEDKKRRWASYKQKIYQEYGRIITSKFASEKVCLCYPFNWLWLRVLLFPLIIWKGAD